MPAHVDRIIHRARGFRADEPQRHAFTANHSTYAEENLGWIKPDTIKKYAGAQGSRAHRALSAHFDLADQIARALHVMNEQVRPANGGVLPDPEARLKNLEAYERATTALANEISAVEAEHFVERESISPWDYSKTTFAESIMLMGRRQALLAMKPEDRFAALDRDSALRQAVLQDRSPATSGLTQDNWDRLFARELRARRPEDMARLNDENEIITQAKRTLEAVKKGLANERMSLGQADGQRAGPRALPDWKGNGSAA